ncbi:MAG: chemotaxis protein [Phormidesmis priestleyi]|uniref:Chemotaxis protein n=1 Tax=Phormidesmis priestleyi TaxID=268141 RepID=A0A2W4ZIR9_9CYAN|nr:MAG: chemotaxis protein [Phormidesmis priestleyi]
MLVTENEPTLKPPNVASRQRDPLGLMPLPVDNRQRFLRFVLSQKNDALLPLEQIVEVMQLSLEDIFPVPDMPGCILGVCSWQGETLWLVDLNHLLGYTPLCQQSQMVMPPFVIVVQSAGHSLGLVVEQVSDVSLFDYADIHMESGLCPASLEPFVFGYCPQQGGTVLSVTSIVNSPLWLSHRSRST